MARSNNRLTALTVSKASSPGMYPDGAGLYLRVTDQGTKNWVLRFSLGGKPRYMGLGPVALYSLQEARAKALDARKLRHEGLDPILVRHQARQRARLEAAKAITFEECAAKYIDAHKAGWSNPKHAGQWTATLKTYAFPIMGGLPVQAVDTSIVMKALEAIWAEKTETASRLRGRVESILDWARVRGFREGENPARWRGHLDALLPASSKVRCVKHHAALPYNEIAKFISDLRLQDGTGARALEFAILTAARTSEVIGATWAEIDLANKTWIIPAPRMKAKREHRVPLSGRAVEILSAMKKKLPHDPAPDAPVFPSQAKGHPLSNMVFLKLLGRMGRDDLTAHGFRSTFRDWTAERTRFPTEVAEMALAHAVSNAVEAAYRRGDMFERRRRLMAEWTNYCGLPRPLAQNGVVALRERA